MAVLPDADRRDGCRKFMSETSADRTPLPCLKADLQAAYNGLDAYFDANQAAINSAIPQPARGALSAQVKARIAIAVLRDRYLKGV